MKGAIIYISSNREKPEFEQKIVQDMLNKKGDLSVYSVTQKPMDLGVNKCVGDVGASGFNFCRQLQMVVEMADADYVISCEADCLYSPDYFKFVPPELDAVYRNAHNFVIPYKKKYFFTKFSQTAFQIAGRNFLLNRLNYLLKGQPQWNIEMRNFPKEIGEEFLENESQRKEKTFKTKYGCFSIKTGDAMRKHTSSGKNRIYELPYWGTAESIIKKYL